MSYITNLDEVVPTLRARLGDYLSLKLDEKITTKKKFKCFVHDDNSPSMALNPKNGEETVHCFSCNRTLDIFSSAAELEGMPAYGSEWVKTTIPHLCELLGIDVKIGEPSPGEAERLKQFRLAQDISDILIDAGDPSGYAGKRNWEQHDIVYGSISDDRLINKLTEKGWDPGDISKSLMVRNNVQSFFGEDKLTFVIKDERGRPCAFQYRNLTDRGPKYVNTPETIIYNKSRILLGFDSALAAAKKDGLIIVEGIGDLAQLRRLGIKNSAAICGTAFTEQHLVSLKSYGIRHLYFCLDWDDAGAVATDRIFFNVLAKTTGVSCWVIDPPDKTTKDLDELLRDADSPALFNALGRRTAFAWALATLSDNEPPDVVCEKMVPLIAADPAAVKRELLIRQLAEFSQVSYVSILSDVNSIRNGKYAERKDKLLAAAEQYKLEVDSDPDNIMVAMSLHEQRVQDIEKEYNRDSVGVNYQLSRYEAIQELRNTTDESATGFKMGWFRQFAEALDDGMPWSSGAYIIVGGRANCFAADTLFWDPITKTKTTADKLTMVSSVDDQTGLQCYGDVVDYIDSGVQECFRVTNGLGLTVETTAEHRYLTPSGWKQLKELQIGDRVAAPSRSGYFGSPGFGVEKAEFLGLMLGDGNMTQARPLFTTCDLDILDRINNLVVGIFGSNIQTSVYETAKFDNANYRMVGFTQADWKTNRDASGYCYSNPVTEFFKSVGCFGKRAWEKTIPEELMNGSKEEVAAVLRGLWTTDGSIYITNKTRPRMEYSCTSEKLTKQIQELLYRFGITSRVIYKPTTTKNWRDKWKLSIDKKACISLYLSEIGFIGEKQNRATNYLGLGRDMSKRDSYGDVVWTKLKEIVSVGEKPTCDITVKDTHSFCLPGYVLHNSGKTATCVMVGSDIALYDEDTIVIYHFTDDNYNQVEPRIKSNFAKMLMPQVTLPIGAIVRPSIKLRDLPQECTEAYRASDDAFRRLLAEERLVILDNEDGSTLSPLQKTLRYYRQRYPSRKIMVITDGIHNYTDSPHLEQTGRITQISTAQKTLTAKYQCSIITTAEYRKQPTRPMERMVLPTDDELADARALMYRPLAIFHVYNDLHDRQDHADIFWKNREGKRSPRLLLHWTKNKISSFKDRLVLDLDPVSVSLTPYDTNLARDEAQEYALAKDEGRVRISGDTVTYIEADDYKENV